MSDEKDLHEFKHALELSPLRHSSRAADTAGLVREQLQHFGIAPDSPYGIRLSGLVEQLYAANASAHDLWKLTSSMLTSLDRSDRIALFNAKRFVCFQLAKILDTLQNPLRATHQSLAP